MFIMLIYCTKLKDQRRLELTSSTASAFFMTDKMIFQKGLVQVTIKSCDMLRYVSYQFILGKKLQKKLPKIKNKFPYLMYSTFLIKFARISL